MQYFIIDMVDRDGYDLIEMRKFTSLDEARAYTLTPSFTSVYEGCNVTDVSIWIPGSPALFKFEATDSEGRLIADVIHYPTQAEAEAKIIEMGYTITSISIVNTNDATD